MSNINILRVQNSADNAKCETCRDREECQNHTDQLSHELEIITHETHDISTQCVSSSHTSPSIENPNKDTAVLMFNIKHANQTDKEYAKQLIKNLQTHYKKIIKIPYGYDKPLTSPEDELVFHAPYTADQIASNIDNQLKKSS